MNFFKVAFPLDDLPYVETGTLYWCTIVNGLCWMNFVSRKLEKVVETLVFILVFWHPCWAFGDCEIIYPACDLWRSILSVTDSGNCLPVTCRSHFWCPSSMHEDFVVWWICFLLCFWITLYNLFLAYVKYFWWFKNWDL